MADTQENKTDFSQGFEIRVGSTLIKAEPITLEAPATKKKAATHVEHAFTLHTKSVGESNATVDNAEREQQTLQLAEQVLKGAGAIVTRLPNQPNNFIVHAFGADDGARQGQALQALGNFFTAQRQSTKTQGETEGSFRRMMRRNNLFNSPDYASGDSFVHAIGSVTAGYRRTDDHTIEIRPSTPIRRDTPKSERLKMTARVAAKILREEGFLVNARYGGKPDDCSVIMQIRPKSRPQDEEVVVADSIPSAMAMRLLQRGLGEQSVQHATVMSMFLEATRGAAI